MMGSERCERHADGGRRVRNAGGVPSQEQVRNPSLTHLALPERPGCYKLMMMLGVVKMAEELSWKERRESSPHIEASPLPAAAALPST